MRKITYLLCCAALVAACASPPQQAKEQANKTEFAAVPPEQVNPYPPTSKADTATATLIRGPTVLTGTGTRLDNADVLIVNGRIEAVGPNLSAPAGARVVDASGRWVTPG